MNRNPAMVICLALALLLGACAISDDNDAVPQESFTVGLVIPHQIVVGIFDNYRLEMAELGYIEGQNITYIQKGPPENLIDLLQMPSQLVEEDVDLIVVVASEGALLAQGATQDIPIVFIAGDEPVEAGLADSLDKPGGNITGVMATGPEARRLELLLEIVPGIETIYVPYTRNEPMSINSIRETEEAAEDFGVTVIIQEIENEAGVQAAIQNIPPETDAIFIPQDILMGTEIEAWTTEALARKLPLSAPGVDEAGSDQYLSSPLMGYGLSVQDLAQRSARLTDQIFRGANPGDLPIESAEFYLLVNLDTARIIGVEVPDHILEQAQIIDTSGN